MARIYDVLQQSGRRVSYYPSANHLTKYGGGTRYSPGTTRSRSYSKSSRSYRASSSKLRSSIVEKTLNLRPSLPLARHPGDAPLAGEIIVQGVSRRLGADSPCSFKSPMIDFAESSAASTAECEVLI